MNKWVRRALVFAFSVVGGAGGSQLHAWWAAHFADQDAAVAAADVYDAKKVAELLNRAVRAARVSFAERLRAAWKYHDDPALGLTPRQRLEMSIEMAEAEWVKDAAECPPPVEGREK